MNLWGLFGLLSVQALFMHPCFSNKNWYPRLIRLALAPYLFYKSLLLPFESTSPPLRADMSTNIPTATTCFYIALKSLEWGLSSGPHYTRTLKKSGQLYHWEKPSDSDKKAQRALKPSFSELIWWTVWQITSFRGFRFDWGPNMPCQRHSMTYLIIRISVNKLLGVLAASLLVAARDAPNGRTVTALLYSIGIPSWFGSRVLGELLYNLAFGVHVGSSMDGKLTLVILFNTIIHNILAPYSFLQPVSDFFDPLHWPVFFDSPELSNSLAEFWGRRWHQLLRQIFKFGGQSPIWIAEVLGFGSGFQKAASLFGPFFISGVLHEYIFWVALRPPHSTFRTILGVFPGSLVFFILQPIGLLIESLLIPRIPKKLDGGRAWTGLFLLVTVTFYRRHYVSNGWYDYQLPPFAKWSWKFILKDL
uniref:Membrane bound O-acyl transferase n=1 Tax=Puccinia cf. psidii AE-2014 TaxID=1505670 RepID=A0A060II31_9BASI|nr:membrane bound O-acyl transferase [Puccinia cf. psidii AE-2014]